MAVPAGLARRLVGPRTDCFDGGEDWQYDRIIKRLTDGVPGTDPAPGLRRRPAHSDDLCSDAGRQETTSEAGMSTAISACSEAQQVRGSRPATSASPGLATSISVCWLSAPTMSSGLVEETRHCDSGACIWPPAEASSRTTGPSSPSLWRSPASSHLGHARASHVPFLCGCCLRFESTCSLLLNPASR